MILDDELTQELAELGSANRARETRSFTGSDRVHPFDAQGRQLLSFASNDYLGLAGHPALAAAAVAEAPRNGSGSGASRLVSGESPAHTNLEDKIAKFLQLPSALLFPTGYQANMGAVTTLAGPDDLIASDAANHASLIDGCRLSRGRIVVYRHADAEAASQALATAGVFRRRLLVTESVFSMDGDRAPLATLAAVATRQQAVFVVDEAHALGALGPGGRGIAAESGTKPDVVIGTLGKAFGAFGGFVAGSLPLRRILINRARHFIYSTAPPPTVAAAATAGIDLAASSEGQMLRDRAARLASQLRAGLARAGIQPIGRDLIVPVVLGSDRDVLEVSAALLEDGILAPAIRPPTVPEGTSRLRLTVSAAHRPADVQRLVEALLTALRRLRP